jgi:hypothetical protein
MLQRRQLKLSALLQPMEIAAVFLLTPLAIIIGHRRPTGAIVVSGSVATVAAIAFWIFLGGYPAVVGFGAETPTNPVLLDLMLYGGLVGGLVLLITAWTLALRSAASARSWGWFFLLVVSGYISISALIIAISLPNLCTVGQVIPFFNTGPDCAEASSLVTVAFQTSHLLGPAVATLYGVLGTSGPHRLPLPPKVRVTTPGTSAEEDTEPDLA